MWLKSGESKRVREAAMLYKPNITKILLKSIIKVNQPPVFYKN